MKSRFLHYGTGVGEKPCASVPFLLTIILHTWASLLHVCLCNLYMLSILEGQRGRWAPWNWNQFVNHHVCVGDKTQVLCKNSQGLDS